MITGMSVYNLGLLSTVLLCVVGIAYSFGYDPVVQTEYGKIRGTLRYALGGDRPVYSYFGVKYGRSPEYVFRFRPAEDPWIWEGVRDATNEDRPLCMQDETRLESLRKDTYLQYLLPLNAKMSEDCLLLDIFSPLSPQSVQEGHEPLPVIAWVHGGSFQSFYSTTKLWSLSAFENVVLVQIQYRVGLFGFLTTDDQWAPPNSALNDQIKALKWIQTNIHAFGGDPKRVTFMGESSGAIAVTSAMLSPLMEGLFHGVFAMSGAPDSMVWQTSQVEKTNRIAKAVNCYFENTAYTSTCIRNKVNASRLMQIAKENDIKFTLQSGSEFIPDYPRKLIESKLIPNPVPLMISVVSGETDYLLGRSYLSEIYHKGGNITRSSAESALRDFLLNFFPGGDMDPVMRAVVNEYMNPNKVGDSGIQLFYGFLQATSDCWFSSKAARIAEKLREMNKEVYFFEFAHKLSMYSKRPDLFPRDYNRNRADHADDLPLIFGIPFLPEFNGEKSFDLYFTELERKLSRKFMKLLAHFATFGTPPPDLNWPQYPRYVIVDDDITVAKEQFQPDRMDLWNEIIPSLAYANSIEAE